MSKVKYVRFDDDVAATVEKLATESGRAETYVYNMLARVALALPLPDTEAGLREVSQRRNIWPPEEDERGQ